MLRSCGGLGSLSLGLVLKVLVSQVGEEATGNDHGVQAEAETGGILAGALVRVDDGALGALLARL